VGAGHDFRTGCDPILNIRHLITNKVPDLDRSRTFLEHSPFPDGVRFYPQEFGELAFVHEALLVFISGCRERVRHCVFLAVDIRVFEFACQIFLSDR
jgi:hypothetical protein